MAERGPLTEPRRLAIAGDWHANQDWAIAAIHHAADAGAGLIVHLGDFGYRFAPAYLNTLSSTLRERGMRLLAIDGNHDHHEWLNGLPRDEYGLHPLAPHLWHLPRGTRWQWRGVTYLALGGAHSVDRRLRLATGLPWWPGERLSARDVHAAVAGGPADVMFCHDAPAGVTVPGLTPHRYPIEEIRQSDAHRHLLRSVVDQVRPALLWHGHYHVHYTSHLSLHTRRCRVVGLDRDDGDGLRANMQIVDLTAVGRIARQSWRPRPAASTVG